MRKDKRPPEEQLADLAGHIRLSFRRWREVKRVGTSDPFWPDGANLNLVRNHILYDQGRLLLLCREHKSLKCPKEARLKPPREVSQNYWARRKRRGK